MALAESFAVIVGLISQFRSERRASGEDDFENFVSWLELHNSHIKEQLELNTNATIYIKALLNQDREALKDQLDRIEVAMTAFASSMEGFSQLAQLVNPNAVLSDQAIDFIRQFAESGASKIIESKIYSGTSYIYLDAKGSVNVKEPRFMEDDLTILVSLGLLGHDYNSSGDNLYIITRAAAQLVGNDDS